MHQCSVRMSWILKTSHWSKIRRGCCTSGQVDFWSLVDMAFTRWSGFISPHEQAIYQASSQVCLLQNVATVWVKEDRRGTRKVWLVTNRSNDYVRQVSLEDFGKISPSSRVECASTNHAGAVSFPRTGILISTQDLSDVRIRDLSENHPPRALPLPSLIEGYHKIQPLSNSFSKWMDLIHHSTEKSRKSNYLYRCSHCRPKSMSRKRKIDLKI